MSAPDHILKQILITEKSAMLSSVHNQYSFEVYKNANRQEIQKAVEKVFGVKVTKVNVLNRKGKVKSNRMRRGAGNRRPGSKRATVTLAEGDKIEVM